MLDELPDSSHPDPLSEPGGILLFGTNDNGWIENDIDLEVGESSMDNRRNNSSSNNNIGVPVIEYDNGEEDDEVTDEVMVDQDWTPRQQLSAAVDNDFEVYEPGLNVDGLWDDGNSSSNSSEQPESVVAGKNNSFLNLKDDHVEKKSQQVREKEPFPSSVKYCPS